MEQVIRSHPIHPSTSRRPTEGETTVPEHRTDRRLRQELVIRAAVALVILVFHETLGTGAENLLIRYTALLALLINVPYYLAARTGRWRRLQAYARMCVDIAFVTLGLYSASGLTAAPYISIYAITPVYAGMTLSSVACLVATWVATASYLAMVFLEHGGWLPVAARPSPDPWTIVGFNLLVLNMVGGLTTLLAEALRRSRRQLAGVNQDLERAYDELFRLNTEIQQTAQLRVLGEVVAGVTHEIRNALTPAIGHIQLARPRVRGLSPEAMQHLDRVEESCDAAMRIVKHALEMARQSPTERVPVAMPEVASRIAALKRYDLHRDGIALRLDFPSGFPLVLGVPFQLQQVLLNLITNAHDAVRRAAHPRTIDIVGLIEAEHAVVEVRDTGPGIPADVLPRVFEPFYTTKAGGTGLGLSISAGIVEGLGGELTAANRPEGGAVFRLRLPLISSEQAARA